jgi:hypothetical protein
VRRRSHSLPPRLPRGNPSACLAANEPFYCESTCPAPAALPSVASHRAMPPHRGPLGRGRNRSANRIRGADAARRRHDRRGHLPGQRRQPGRHGQDRRRGMYVDKTRHNSGDRRSVSVPSVPEIMHDARRRHVPFQPSTPLIRHISCALSPLPSAGNHFQWNEGIDLARSRPILG